MAYRNPFPNPPAPPRVTPIAVGDTVYHRTKPSEPHADPTNPGTVLRITPSGRGIPAAALINWCNGGFTTWEQLGALDKPKRKGQL
jgi:hypothetical protein